MWRGVTSKPPPARARPGSAAPAPRCRLTFELGAPLLGAVPAVARPDSASRFFQCLFCWHWPASRCSLTPRPAIRAKSNTANAARSRRSGARGSIPSPEAVRNTDPRPLNPLGGGEAESPGTGTGNGDQGKHAGGAGAAGDGGGRAWAAAVRALAGRLSRSKTRARLAGARCTSRPRTPWLRAAAPRRWSRSWSRSRCWRRFQSAR